MQAMGIAVQNGTSTAIRASVQINASSEQALTVELAVLQVARHAALHDPWWQ